MSCKLLPLIYELSKFWKDSVNMEKTQSQRSEKKYPPWPFQFLEYQWSVGEFDTLGKLGSANRARGTPP